MPGNVVLLGGGAAKFNPANPDACGATGDYVSKAEQSGYTVVQTRQEMKESAAAGAWKVLGLFTPGGMTPEVLRTSGTTERRGRPGTQQHGSLQRHEAGAQGRRLTQETGTSSARGAPLRGRHIEGAGFLPRPFPSSSDFIRSSHAVHREISAVGYYDREKGGFMTIANNTICFFPVKFHRNASLLRSGRTLSPRFIRFVARLAIWSEWHRDGDLFEDLLVRIAGIALDKASGSPLICAKVRDEMKRRLRSGKVCPPGWRKACFNAADRRFGPLTL